jgi:ankyrin repeat protein
MRVNSLPFMLFLSAIFFVSTARFAPAQQDTSLLKGTNISSDDRTKSNFIKLGLKTETGADTQLRVHPLVFSVLQKEDRRNKIWEEAFTKMLSDKANMTDPREEIQLAFSLAVASNNLQALRILMTEGPNVNKPHFTTKKETPLAYALQQGKAYEGIVALLLAEGADVMQLGATTSALHLAVTLDNPALFDTILNLAPHTNIIDKKGRMPLWYAVSSASLGRVQMLMDKGADPNFKGPTMEGLLYAAFQSKSEEMVLWAMENTLVDDQLMPNPMSPLVHQVVAFGNLNWLKVLADRGLQVQELDREGRNALFVLCENPSIANRTEWARILVKEFGLSALMTDANQISPMLVAKQNKDKELTKAFKKYKN